jgi:primosomal protein N' (replication factor Y)
MLAKGLHFPNVTLVGIISADTSLFLPDFRANERTFQLISQVAGRTGRSEKKGIVFVQTFLPNQPAIKFALKNDFHGFLQEELKHRKACNLPPYWRLAAIVLRDQKFDKLEKASALLKQRIDDTIQRHQLKLTVRGPNNNPGPNRTNNPKTIHRTKKNATHSIINKNRNRHRPNKSIVT